VKIPPDLATAPVTKSDPRTALEQVGRVLAVVAAEDSSQASLLPISPHDETICSPLPARVGEQASLLIVREWDRHGHRARLPDRAAGLHRRRPGRVRAEHLARRKDRIAAHHRSLGIPG
jgi:hypothetical protein